MPSKQIKDDLKNNKNLDFIYSMKLTKQELNVVKKKIDNLIISIRR